MWPPKLCPYAGPCFGPPVEHKDEQRPAAQGSRNSSCAQGASQVRARARKGAQDKGAQGCAQGLAT